MRVFWRAGAPSATTLEVDTAAFGVEVRSGDVITLPRGEAVYFTLVDASGNVSPTQSYRVLEAAPSSSTSSSFLGGSTLTAVIAGGAALIALLALAALVVVRRRRRQRRARDILSLAQSRNVHTDVGEADSATALNRSRGMLPEFESYTLKEGAVLAVATPTRGGTTATTARGPTPTGMTPMVAIQHGYTLTEPGWSEYSVTEEVEVHEGTDENEHYAVQGVDGPRVCVGGGGVGGEEGALC